MRFVNSRTAIIDIVILVILSLVPLLWLKADDKIIAGYEINLMLLSITPASDFTRNLYMWSEQYNDGADNSWGLFSLFSNLVLAMPLWLGASLLTSQKIYLITLFGLSGFSMYWMVSVLFPEEKEKRSICLTASIFYMFSYQIMMQFMRGAFAHVFCYGLLPLFITLVFKALRDPRTINKYTIILLFLAFPFSALTHHLAQFEIFVYALTAFIVFIYWGVEKERKGAFLKSCAFLVLAFIFVNLWWILPIGRFIVHYSLPNEAFYGQAFFNKDTLAYYSGPELFFVFQQHGIAHYFNLGKEAFYQSKGSFFLGLAFPMLAYSALFFIPRNRYVKFFVALSIIAIFLSKGAYPPLGGIYEWLYFNVPGFFLIRSAHRSWPTLFLLAWAPLIGLSVARIGEVIERKSPLNISRYVKYTVPVLFCCTVFVYSWPLFTGDHLRHKGTLLAPSITHNIPYYYKEADAWSKNQPDSDCFKIYNFIDTYLINTKWGYGGPDLTKQIISVPQVSLKRDCAYLEVQSGRKYIDAFNNLFKRWEFGNLGRVLSMLSAKYVMIQNDFYSWSLPFSNANDYYSSLLGCQEGISLEKSIGQLDFYRNKSYSPRLYAVPRAFLVHGGLDSLMPLSLTDYIGKAALLFDNYLTSAESQTLNEKIDGIVIYNDCADRSVLDVSKKIVIFNTGTELSIPKESDYRLSLIMLPEVERDIKVGYQQSFTNGPDLTVWDLKGVGARLKGLSEEEDFLKINLEFDKNEDKPYLELKTNIKEGIDLSEYHRIVLSLGVENKAHQEIKVLLGYDYTAYTDNHIDGWLEVPLNEGGDSPGKRDFDVNVYELISKHVGCPPDRLGYYRVKSLRVILKKTENDDKKSRMGESCFYLKNIKFLGDSGVIINQPVIPDVVNLNVVGNKIPIPMDKSGRGETRQVHFEEGKHTISIDPEQKGRFLLHLESVDNEPSSNPEPKILYEYKRLNPTKYKVYVHTDGPFWLILNDSFDPNWQAYSKDKDIVYQHILVNGFANGFYIDRTGDYEVVLEYRPQKLFTLSALISVITMIGILACFALTTFRPKNH